MDLKAIGNRIRIRRKDLSLKQEELAAKADISTTFAGLVESGEKAPSLETFINIANALIIPADFLLEDVLEVGYQIKMSRYTERMKALSPEERARICDVVEAMLQRAERDAGISKI